MNSRSLQRLRKVHPALRLVLAQASVNSPVAFEVGETVRTQTRQQELYDAHATTTLHSRHIPGKDGLARAADIICYVNGKVRWDWPLYCKAAEHIKATAKELKIPLEWGGDWKTFKDGPHFQLPWKEYP